jgi:hypothetical protein
MAPLGRSQRLSQLHIQAIAGLGIALSLIVGFCSLEPTRAIARLDHAVLDSLIKYSTTTVRVAGLPVVEYLISESSTA